VPASALRELFDLVLPRECGGCGAPGSRWCPACAASLARAAPRPWRPTPSPAGLPLTVAALPYAGPVREAVVAFKDGGRHDLLAVLAPPLAAALGAGLGELAGLAGATAAGPPPASHGQRPGRGREGPRAWVVPVPSSAAARRRRGGRPTYELARGATSLLPGGTGQVAVVPALGMGRKVADQAGLDRARRATNLAAAMTVPPRFQRSLAGRPCLLVDDVITTGATLREAARALAEAGAGPVVAVTLAATTRRRGGAPPGVPGAGRGV